MDEFNFKKVLKVQKKQNGQSRSLEIPLGQNNIEEEVPAEAMKEEDKEEFKCQRCFLLSKLMVKQLDKLIEVNLSIDNYVQNAIFSSTMITNLINELLDQAKLDKATFDLVANEFNLFEVIIQAFQIVVFQAEKKGVNLQL